MEKERQLQQKIKPIYQQNSQARTQSSSHNIGHKCRDSQAACCRYLVTVSFREVVVRPDRISQLKSLPASRHPISSEAEFSQRLTMRYSLIALLSCTAVLTWWTESLIIRQNDTDHTASYEHFNVGGCVLARTEQIYFNPSVWYGTMRSLVLQSLTLQ